MKRLAMKRVAGASIRPVLPALVSTTESGAASTPQASLLSPAPRLIPSAAPRLPAPPSPKRSELDALRRVALRQDSPLARSSDADATDPVGRMLKSVALLLALHDDVRLSRAAGGDA